MLLSICIPTYNRGHRAKQLVCELLALPYEMDDIEIVVSNNGSTKYIDEYNEIEKLEDAGIYYNRLEENKGYMMNLNHVIKMSHGEYCMLISDEDSVEAENLETYMELLRNTDKLAIVKGATSIQYKDDPCVIAAPGHEAIDSFYLAGNYMSGTIYNRSIITDDVVDEYERKYANNIAYIHYPHMFYDAYSLSEGYYIHNDRILIVEGACENDMKTDANAPTLVYNTYQNRIEQMMGFIEHIRDLKIGAGEKFHMFQVVCNKYVYLLWLVHKGLKDTEADLEQALATGTERMKEGLRMIGLPLMPDEYDEMDGFVDDLIIYMKDPTVSNCF